MNSKYYKMIYQTLVVVGSILTTLVLGSIILLIIGADVGKTFQVIFFYPLQSFGFISEIFIRAIPLIFIALGVSVAFRSGILNIGAEGQMLFGILGTTAIVVYMPGLPALAMLPLALVAGVIAGAFYGAIPGALKAKLGVSELLSTVMLNYVSVQVYTLMLRKPFIDPKELVTGSGIPQSARFPESAWLDRFITGSRLHAGLFIAIALALVIYFLLWRTSYGYKMRAAGAEMKAARYGGIFVARYLIAAMAISGAFAGLAGSVEVMGLHRRAIEGISSGYGFTGIVVALFGGLHPLGIIPAAFFFGLILVGAEMTQQMVGVPPTMVQVLQGLIILTIVSAKMVINDPYMMQRFGHFMDKAFANKGKNNE